MDSVCIFCSSIVIMSISLHFLTCRRRIWLCGPWADSPAETQRSWSHGDIPPAWSGEDNMGMTSGPGRIVVTLWNSWFMTSFIWFKAFPLFFTALQITVLYVNPDSFINLFSLCASIQAELESHGLPPCDGAVNLAGENLMNPLRWWACKSGLQQATTNSCW